MREEVHAVTIRPLNGKGNMKSIRSAAVAALLAGGAALAHAGEFTCVAGSFSDCALATSTLSWTWNGLDFTIANSGSGYVSEVYFDLGAGMGAQFLGGTGGTVNFYVGASPGSLPGGNSVGFVSDTSFDSDGQGQSHWGVDNGETATFRISGASADSFDLGTLAAGLHVRSLIDASTSLVTIGSPVPEPETYAMMLLGLGAVVWTARRKR
jgi:hypothetical protein